MKLENQVTSLSLSKELKELGYEQEGIWYWSVPKWCVETNEFRPNVKGYEITLIRGRLSRKSDRVFFVAPTVTELILALMYFEEEFDMCYKLREVTANRLAQKWISRGTPIIIEKSFRDIDEDFDR